MPAHALEFEDDPGSTEGAHLRPVIDGEDALETGKGVGTGEDEDSVPGRGVPGRGVPGRGVPGRDGANGNTARSARHGHPTGLVLRARRGNRRAFDELWERYAPTLHAILLSMVPDSEAEDLLQEVAVAALSSIKSLKNAHSFAGWMCAIARNAGRNALATRRQRRPVSLQEAETLEAPPEGDPMEADEILEQLRTLPTCYREPLVLRLLLEMSGAEIAMQTGMTEGSVRVNLCRGMKLLRHRLQNWESEA